jgi:hypothetical protein
MNVVAKADESVKEKNEGVIYLSLESKFVSIGGTASLPFGF